MPTGTAPTGGRQLVSLQDAEDSLDPDCAPSYQLQIGELDTANDDNNGNLAAEISLVALPQLEQGRDLVIPDPEGPDSEYNVTRIAGYVTLDSIRAVEHFAPAELDGVKTQVALAGYSGGGLETAAANELEPSYAPELKIVAVTAGGVPPFDEENLQYLDGSVAAGAVMAAMIGIDRAYPRLDLYSLLNADGQSFAQKVLTGCASAVFDAPFTNYNTWTTVPNAFELPSVEHVIATNALGHAVPTAPTPPGAAGSGVTAPSLSWLGSDRARRVPIDVARGGAGHEPSRGTTIPPSFSKYSGGLIRLYGSLLLAGPPRSRFGGRDRVREISDELGDRVGG